MPQNLAGTSSVSKSSKSSKRWMSWKSWSFRIMRACPRSHLTPKTGQVQVLLTAHGNWVDKASLVEVQKSLKDEAQNTLSLLKLYMRELSDADVDISFSKVNTQTGEIVNDFAEYKNGELTIRH
jgi:hypothetical protein